MPVPRVLIADANLLIRRGLRALLQQAELEVIAEVESERELLQRVEEEQPDVVLLDCNQPGLLEVSRIPELKALSPNTHLLIITDDCGKEAVLEALHAGAIGYVLKLCGEQEILHAIKATARGERSMCSQVLDSVLATRQTPHPLSSRETEIIQLIADGKSTMEIADILCLSHHTINSHRKNILRKLGIKSPAEMVVKALDLGIVKLQR